MYAVINGTIQHFPARNLSLFKNSGIDYTYFDDDGNKIENNDVEDAADEEIKKHTIIINENNISTLKNMFNEDGSIKSQPTRIFPQGDIAENPIKKIEKAIQAGEV